MGAGGEGQYSAVQLFVSSTHRVRPDLGLTADDLASVGYICHLVEGMPLAILLAADWARILTPAEIAARLSGETANDTPGTGRGLDLPETDWHDVPARQRSMRAVFDRSWDLLTEREREVVAALSVFRGGFTHEAAHQVSGASLRELIALGWVALVREAYTEAQSLFRESADACQPAGQRDMFSWGLAFLGYADRGLGQLAQAGRHFCQALRIATETQCFVARMFTLPGVALLLADLDHKEQAVELYALASRYPMVAHSRWFADVVGCHIAAVAATLPPDVVAAAEQRGRARDLDATMAELLAARP